MRSTIFSRPLFAALIFCLAYTGAYAQTTPAPKPYEPQVFQQGKDVIWVPTPDALVAKMLDMAKVTPQDYVIDLGSGDGRTVIAAAKRGARALGIEYNPDMVELSKGNATKAGVADKATFVKADLFESDFSQATVITMYLLPGLNLRLRPTILNLKPGTRIVSHSFNMAEWQPDETTDKDAGVAFMWIVPAKVEGTWQLPQGELALKQTFQTVAGTLKLGATAVPITDGKLRGDQLTFTAGNAQYSGRVMGSAIEGTVKGSTAGSWKATRN